MKRFILPCSILLAWPVGCGDDQSRGDEGALTFGSGGSDASTSADASQTSADTQDATTAGDGDGDGDPSTSGDGDGDPSTASGDGDGDPSTTSGDGDGDPSTTSGDGDGDLSTSGDGDGDGDPSTSGDGDGDPTTTGDGDGDPSTTGDGDGDPTTTGDGDGDPSTTTGDGDGDPTTTTGDGDGDGDPSTTTGDGDGDGDPSTTGDGDGDGDPSTSGDGDGDGDPTTTGDGDGDGDGCPGDGSQAWINEFHYDNMGDDVGEFIEIAGAAGTSLDCYQVVLYNGNDSGVYNTLTPLGTIPDQIAGAGAFVIALPTNGLQNGPNDGIALIFDDTVVLEFLSYEGTLTAVDGPAMGLTSTDIGASESGDTTQPGFSLQRIGTGAQASDFIWQGDPQIATPGLINVNQTIQ